MGSFVSSPEQVSVSLNDVARISYSNLTELSTSHEKMWKMRDEVECASDGIGCENEEIEAKKHTLVCAYFDAVIACSSAHYAVKFNEVHIGSDFIKCVDTFLTWKHMRESYLVAIK